MAFTGLHVVCGYAGAPSQRHRSQAILGEVKWTESPSSGVSTTNVAVAPSDTMGDPIFRIRASADAWVSIGASPNASANPRLLVPAGEDYDVFVEPGDKLAWLAA